MELSTECKKIENIENTVFLVTIGQCLCSSFCCQFWHWLLPTVELPLNCTGTKDPRIPLVLTPFSVPNVGSVFGHIQIINFIFRQPNYLHCWFSPFWHCGFPMRWCSLCPTKCLSKVGQVSSKCCGIWHFCWPWVPLLCPQSFTSIWANASTLDSAMPSVGCPSGEAVASQNHNTWMCLPWMVLSYRACYSLRTRDLRNWTMN